MKKMEKRKGQKETWVERIGNKRKRGTKKREYKRDRNRKKVIKCDTKDELVD